MPWSNTLATVVTLLLSAFVYFANAVYQHRSRINQLRKQGVVGSSLFMGHTIVANFFQADAK
jgi:hypothetical protein